MNKFYIQIAFFLLIIPLYVNNKTLATELVPKKDAKSESKKSYPVNDNTKEIYQKNKHLLYTDIEETINACKFMNAALKQLEHHATTEYIIYEPNKYNELLNKIWDPDNGLYLNKADIKKKIVRVYTPNLVMIQQRSRRWPWSRRKYFYALAAKFKKKKTIIVMASANIIDHNRKNKKYFENKIIENANLFEAEIDSEDDIRNGKIKKTMINMVPLNKKVLLEKL
ncbi:fam-a protein [Plasmodium yoelii]|uniref:Fam-a protein n=1 Tax=Plasmodium yoelii TaxID=5861 RepID=A0A4V0KHP9_PLAYE|nr:fam-a protein [Plasmodium yoelii]VTZ75032.1 fam-a protein [Plasmodium yoelii]|eukprot:XP_034493405.1 fam-a protein [Plasmodium yoelii]